MEAQKEVRNDMARTTFYVTADLFDRALSRSAKLVLTYLSRVANREGVCYPSIATIAKNCACCENTVRKAMQELCEAGVVRKEERYAQTANGKVRRRANRYTLSLPGFVSPTAKTEPTPLQKMNHPPAKTEGEINDNSKLTIAENTPSVRKETDRTELHTILDKLYLHLYKDRAFADSVEHAIQTMFYADSVTVKGKQIPQGAVRSALHLLTIDHIDFVQAQLRNLTEPVLAGERYLISCLYNAPIDCAVNNVRWTG